MFPQLKGQTIRRLHPPASRWPATKEQLTRPFNLAAATSTLHRAAARPPPCSPRISNVPPLPPPLAAATALLPSIVAQAQAQAHAPARPRTPKHKRLPIRLPTAGGTSTSTTTPYGRPHSTCPPWLNPPSTKHTEASLQLPPKAPGWHESPTARATSPLARPLEE